MSPKLRLPRFQYTLRTLFLVMTLLAVWLGVTFDRARRQQRACEAFRLFGSFAYSSRSFAPDTSNVPFRGGEPFAPKWLVNIVGMDALANVHSLFLDRTTGQQVGDAELSYFKDLPHVESLILNSDNITDKGLVHLHHLGELKMLWLGGDQITDDGLRHLAPLDQLCYLSLSSSHVTDAGLVHLAELDELCELELHCSITGKGLESLSSLAKLKGLASYGKGGNQALRVFSELDMPTMVPMVRVPLSDILDYLADFHNIPFRLDEPAMREKGISAELPVTCDLQKVPLAAALDTMLEPLGLDWMVGPGGIVVTTKETAAAKQASLERLKSQLPGLNRAYIYVDW